MKSDVTAAALTIARAVTVPLILVLAWYAVVRLGWVAAVLLPGPEQVFGKAAVRLFSHPEIYLAILASLHRIFAGWLIAVVLGTLIGLAASLSRRGRLILEGPMSAC